MRKILIAFTVMLSVFLSGVARAERTEEEIYRQTLKVIIDHDHPQRFAVWNQTIIEDVINTKRVPPRQNPEHQFVRAMHSVTPALERSLLDKSRTQSVLPVFDILPTVATFLGFVDSAELRRAEEEAKPNDFKSWLECIGFSKIGFSNHGQTALVYAEKCSVAPNGSCGGEGYWFVRKATGWHLKGHAFLWDGGINSTFWKLQDQLSTQSTR